MPIEIKETFRVQAPVDAVWRFIMDPHQVVTCMPGAALEQVVDDHTFVGSVKVRVGAITTSYKGRVSFTQVDEQQHVIQMLGEGRETGGGMAKGTMSSRLRALSDGQTEVVAEASVDLTGRIMQVGRGMIQGVAQQLFKQFAAALKQHVEVPEGPAGGSTPASGTCSVTATEPQAIRILPIVLQVLWSAIVRFLSRLFGRGS